MEWRLQRSAAWRAITPALERTARSHVVEDERALAPARHRGLAAL